MIRYQDLEIDLDRQVVRRQGGPVRLTATEWKLLERLARSRGRVLTRTMLLEQIWDVEGSFVDENTLSVHIRRLRQKLEPDPEKPPAMWSQCLAWLHLWGGAMRRHEQRAALLWTILALAGLGLLAASFWLDQGKMPWAVALFLMLCLAVQFCFSAPPEPICGTGGPTLRSH